MRGASPSQWKSGAFKEVQRQSVKNDDLLIFLIFDILSLKIVEEEATKVNR